jgi:hypothetical protein
MKRFLGLWFVTFATALAGCTAPATSKSSGSFWSSDRGAAVNDSLDRHSSHVDRFSREAEAIQRDFD